MNTAVSVSEVGHHTTTLRRQESVLLSAALVAHVCEDLQVRILFIKGPVAVQVGVRPSGDSSDIDLLVEPEKIQTLVEGLGARGWQPRWDGDNRAHPLHSVTMYHPRWPTDIDIHFAFPGIEEPEESYFPKLWEHRQVFSVAARPVFGLDLAGATIIQALHSLRALSLPKNSSELGHLLHGAPKPAWADIYELAEGIGALGSLKPYLIEAYPEATGVEFPTVSTEWLLRTAVSAPGVHRLLQLSSAPWNQRWALIRLALFPPRRILGGNNSSLDGASRKRVMRIRILRWVSFLGALPATIREYRMARNGPERGEA